ncbi:conserved hypothetical protein [Clostridium neonatale]|nr:conserved hypothetical protein [Clostridium neonatale]CAI3664735.1 conserved hypothetical protein [Clostridium neonatale]
MAKMAKKLVALVEFPKSSFGHKYGYFTYIEDLKENDLLLVQTRTSYSLALFRGYTNKKAYTDVAKSWIVKNLQSNINDFEEKLLLGDLE